MTLLLSFIPVCNNAPGTVPAMNSLRSVSDTIKMFNLLLKKTGNDGPQLKKESAYAQEIAAVKAERKVFLQASAFGKVCSTGNRMPSACAAPPTAATVTASWISPPAAAVHEVSVPRAASVTPAPSQAEAKPEPAVAQTHSQSTRKTAPSLLTRVKQQFRQIWSSLQRYFSSFTETSRLHQQETLMRDKNSFRDKQKNYDTLKEISHAYYNNPLNALRIYNAEKQSRILGEIQKILSKANQNNLTVDMRKLCEQANQYAVSSGANAIFLL
ncbi:hypothetical protein [Pantoea eucrina]|uniref:hypothetical protein n=1 Tax=Pantoea eucrina TaxID=472693 RepID=UPI00053620A7|nr:hypothetical protein [Pantoea eucrina]AIX51212.1 hypothetical protein PSNIH1_13750 [Pantoea sp. PSNIH1]UBB14685.1 hypothetical protein LAC65_07785 [Pantoea eucrina]